MPATRRGRSQAAGHAAEAVSLDVTDGAAVEKLPGEIVERHGRLDIVVSNAGIARDQLVMRMKREDWDAVLATNLTATFVLAQAAIRPMLKQRGGRIIAISSVVGQTGNAGTDQLRGVEGRADRIRQGARARGGVARDHRQRGGAGID